MVVVAQVIRHSSSASWQFAPFLFNGSMLATARPRRGEPAAALPRAQFIWCGLDGEACTNVAHTGEIIARTATHVRMECIVEHTGGAGCSTQQTAAPRLAVLATIVLPVQQAWAVNPSAPRFTRPAYNAIDVIDGVKKGTVIATMLPIRAMDRDQDKLWFSIVSVSPDGFDDLFEVEEGPTVAGGGKCRVPKR